MASDYQHDTDRVDGTALATCTDCDEYSASVEYESAADDDVLADLKRLVSDECPHCGGDVAFMEQEQPVEVLE